VPNNDKCLPVLFLEPEGQGKEGALPLLGKAKQEEMKCLNFPFVTDNFPERLKFQGLEVCLNRRKIVIERARLFLAMNRL
jgi:hypothetical protein